MDIIKELKSLKKEEANIDKLMTAITIEQKELDKKAHLLRVIDLSMKIEDVVSKDFCKNAEIKKIQLKLSHEYDNNTSDYELQLNYRLVDANSFPIYLNDTPDNSKELRKFLSDVFQPIRDLNIGLYNEDFSLNIPVFLKLEAGIGEKILDLLLSKELRRIYDYSHLEISLSNNEENNRKRIKM